MTGPISRNRLLGSLKNAASWPGADRNTVVTLAASLVAARADAEGSRYFQDLSERNPADATAQALAGFFAVRAGHDVAAAITTQIGRASCRERVESSVGGGSVRKRTEWCREV